MRTTGAVHDFATAFGAFAAARGSDGMDASFPRRVGYINRHGWRALAGAGGNRTRNNRCQTSCSLQARPQHRKHSAARRYHAWLGTVRTVEQEVWLQETVRFPPAPLASHAQHPGWGRLGLLQPVASQSFKGF